MPNIPPYQNPETLKSFYYASEDRLALRREIWKHYGTNTQPLSEWILDSLPGHQTPGVRWLDVGCGQGALLRTIRQHNPSARLTGVDVSPAMVEATKIRLCDQNNIRVLEADAEHLPFADHRFDLISYIHIFHHLADPRRALQECQRLLAPNGVAFLTIAQTDVDNGLNRVHYSAVRDLGLPSFLCTTAGYLPQDHHELVGWMSEAGFRVESSIYESSLLFTDPAPALAYYTSAMMYRNTDGPTDPRISPAQWEALAQQVQQQIEEEIQQTGSFRSAGNVSGYRLTV